MIGAGEWMSGCVAKVKVEEKEGEERWRRLLRK